MKSNFVYFATPESSIINERDGIADGDGGQATAMLESTAFNGYDWIGDDDGGQATAILVFATCCVPICFD